MTKYQLNPDNSIVKKVKEGLKKNDGYCPCVLEKSLDTKCPCKNMRENNHCCCGLYVTN